MTNSLAISLLKVVAFGSIGLALLVVELYILLTMPMRGNLIQLVIYEGQMAIVIPLAFGFLALSLVSYEDYRTWRDIHKWRSIKRNREG